MGYARRAAALVMDEGQREILEKFARLTHESTAEGETRWSCRSAAQIAGVSRHGLARLVSVDSQCTW